MFKYRLQKYYLFLILTSFYRLIYHILETKCTALAKDGERHPRRLRTPSTRIANATHADRGRYTTTKVDVLFDKS
mgnify:CR=1 FL=1